MLRHDLLRRTELSSRRLLLASRPNVASRSLSSASFPRTSTKLIIPSTQLTRRARTYATAAATPAKPKSASSGSAKAKTTKPKSKAKAAAAKPKKKKAAKPKKVVARKKKVKAKPTELEAKRAKVRALRALALLDGPKLLPAQAYNQYIAQSVGKGSSATGQLADAASQYASLSAAEREELDRTVARNKEQNAATLKQWVESHTPATIVAANNARRHLTRLSKEAAPEGASRRLVAHRFALIRDERISTPAVAAYAAFTRDRWASGEFSGVAVGEAARSIAREWKELGATEKAEYTDAAKQQRTAYETDRQRALAEV